jgi:hypothetical protein
MNRINLKRRNGDWHRVAIFTLLATTVAAAPHRADSCNEIVVEAMKIAKAQQERLPAYSVLCRYTIRNKHLISPVVLQVLWKYEPGAGKRFEILDEGGASGMTRQAILKVLADEANSSQLDIDPAAITPEHYAFEATTMDQLEYKLHLTPKVKTKYLLNGYAYIFRKGGSLIRVQGTTSKRLSFWVGEADILQEFANYDGYWLPSRTQSTAEVRLIGRTELTIEAGAYHFGAQSAHFERR